MTTIRELIKQRIAIEMQIKEQIESDVKNEQKDFVPAWYVYKNWDEDNEYCIEFIRDAVIYSARVSQNEFIKPYGECKGMFDKESVK